MKTPLWSLLLLLLKGFKRGAFERTVQAIPQSMGSALCEPPEGLARAL